ncbi:MAG: M28 family metallopeptidase [Steroidobacteraceae bacterium]
MRILTLLCLLAPLPAVAADDLPPASPAAVRAHVGFLADDLLEGRATGSRGYDIAARYVAAQLESYGIEPAGQEGGWLQPVMFVQGTRVIPQGRVVLTRDGQTTELEPAKDFVPGVNYFTADAEVSAPLVFVGFGIHAPKYGYDDFGDIDLTGKIAVVLWDSPPTLESSIRAHFSRERTREIARRGAVGMISLPTPKSEARSPFEKSVLQAVLPRRRLVDDAGQPVEAFPEIRASASLSLDTAELIFAGGPKTLEQVWADAEAGVPQSFDLPGTLTLVNRTALGKSESANVVGLLPGVDPVLKDEYVVFSAHLDHLGRGATVNGDNIYNGALDNASGIAVMLETARLLASAAERPRRSILFVAVTGEENGLLGSERFAKSPTVPREGLVANVNMDMPVLLYPAAGFTAFGAEHSTLGEVARRALEAEGLEMVPDQTPDEVIFVRSDQYSFVKEGIPALYVDDGKRSSDPAIDPEQVFREHMRRDYHMPSDDMRLPIHWESMAALARVNARIGLGIANDPERPSWLPGDFFGDTFGKTVQE